MTPLHGCVLRVWAEDRESDKGGNVRRALVLEAVAVKIVRYRKGRWGQKRGVAEAPKHKWTETSVGRRIRGKRKN